MADNPPAGTPSLAQSLASEIRRAARLAHSEEDFKMAVEHALAPLRSELAISPQYESTYPASVSILGGGSSDAVYGHLIIEYKKPGRLATAAGQREATTELQRYLFGEATKYGADWDSGLRRMIGLALDGETIFFLRYRGDRPAGPTLAATIPTHQMSLFPIDDQETPGFQRIGPFPVDADSIDLLVVYLRALRRRALTPEALATEFGPGGDVARRLVPALYERLLDTALANGEIVPRVQTLFAEWDRLFGIVYGQDLDRARRDTTYLGRLYGMTGDQDLKALLFAVHTYYALFMKLLAAELASLQGGALVTSPLAGLQGLSERAMRERLADLENGGLFARVGIHNFLEGDFFGWYLDAWAPEFEAPIRDLARALGDYEPATGSILPEATRDLLKKLYQYLVPKQLRHDLGEYYTPDWLAQLVIEESGYDGARGERFLDPACGSGTFLVLAIRRAREWGDDHLVDANETVRHILADIVGFDLNPLAVIAARTNYLLALGNLIRHLPSVEIPVYLCDSVLTPAGTSGAEPAQTQALFDDYELTSTVGTFAMPRAVVAGGSLAAVAGMLEDAVKLRYTTDEFQQRIRRALPDLEEPAIGSLGLLFEKLAQLERDGCNGLWARLIKNAFAPVFAGRFEFVIGNPPWIRWTYLADAYRAATLPMWTEYGLFSLRGMAARLGSGEKDFSMLFTYAAADRYLSDGGILGFVITQEVVKGKGAGEGFRRFRIGRSGAELKVLKAHDLVAVAPFEGASNKTSVLVMRKGEPTVYPLPYTKWRRNGGVGQVPTDATLRRALELTSREDLVARPIGTSSVSAWQTAPQSSIGGFNAFRGTAAYVARRGAGTDPYGVFWLRVLEVRDGVLAVENLPELGKREVEKVTAQLIEPDLVFPAIRGSDIRRWAARPEINVLVTQDPSTRRPYPAHDLRVRLPLTYKYLDRFRDVLLSRGSATIRELAERSEPWAMFGIGEYTFAPYRVTWKRMASELVTAVLGTWHTSYGQRLLLPTETTSFIPAQTIEEANYLAAVLNAPPVRAYVLSFSAPGRGFGAPSIMQQLALPTYDPANPVHDSLSAAGARAAELAANQAGSAQAELVEIERELSGLVADLFGIPERDLRGMLRTELPAGPLGLHD